MVNQDPCSRSIAGDSGHGMMAITSEAEPINSNEELIRAMGGISEDIPAGINENISAWYLSDVEWKEELKSMMKMSQYLKCQLLL